MRRKGKAGRKKEGGGGRGYEGRRRGFFLGFRGGKGGRRGWKCRMRRMWLKTDEDYKDLCGGETHGFGHGRRGQRSTLSLRSVFALFQGLFSILLRNGFILNNSAIMSYFSNSCWEIRGQSQLREGRR